MRKFLHLALFVATALAAIHSHADATDLARGFAFRPNHLQNPAAFPDKLPPRALGQKKAKRNRRRLELMDDYQNAVNWVPKQLGVPYTAADTEGRDISTVGNTVLGYGLYNNYARDISFRQLKEQLISGMESRKLYLDALSNQLQQLSQVDNTLKDFKKLIENTGNYIGQELDKEITLG